MLRNYFLTTLRSLVNNKTHASINIAGLSIGIACALLIVLWIRNEMSYDKFHADSDSIYRVMTNYKPGDGATQTFNTVPRNVAEKIKSSVPEVSGITQLSTADRWPNTLCFKHGKNYPEECVYRKGIYADDNFFSIFNFNIVRGAESPFVQPTNIAVSQQMADALFPNDNPIGKTVMIDNWVELTISSVFSDVPSNSSLKFDFVLPFAVMRNLTGMNDTQWQDNFLETYVRVNAGSDIAAMSEKFNHSSVRPETLTREGVSFFSQPFTDWRLHDNFQNGQANGGRIEYVNIFSITAIVILLMACINFINLATARATTRGKEIGVRKVIGANRMNLILQFIGESFVIVFIAFLIGLAMVQLSLPIFTQVTEEQLAISLFSGSMPYVLAAILLLICLLSGLYPALVLSSFNPVRALKNKINESGSRNSLRKSLLIVQLSSSAVLIIFTTVLFLQMNMVKSSHLGFDRENVIRIEPTFALLKKFDALKSELLKNPLVVNSSLAAGDVMSISQVIHEVSWNGKNDETKIPFKIFSCGYDFTETMNMELLQGEKFIRGKSTEKLQVILTEEAVKTMNLNDPIGAEISLYNDKAEVVGVIKDVHGQSLHKSIEPTIFKLVPKNENLYTIYVRYQPGKTQEALSIIKDTYNKMEPDFSMVYWFLDDSFDKQYKSENITGRLIIFFTLAAVCIALLGILGLSTYNVLRRLREIGVRKVFGASAIQIVSLLSREFITLTLIAMVIAAPVGAYLSQRWLDGFAYHITLPWWVYGFSMLIILILALITIGSQSIKAALTNPSRILKDE